MKNLTFSKVSMSLTILALLAVLGLAGCGGGGGTDVPNDTQPTSQDMQPTSQRVDVQFGVDNSINVVAGDTPVFSPVQISSDTTGLSVRLVEAPSFVAVDNFSLKVDASAVPAVAALYPITVTVVNSENSEVGRVSGVIDVATILTASAATLANSQTVKIDGLVKSLKKGKNRF